MTLAVAQHTTCVSVVSRRCLGGAAGLPGRGGAGGPGAVKHGRPWQVSHDFSAQAHRAPFMDESKIPEKG